MCRFFVKKFFVFCYLYENETIMEKEIVGMKMVGDYIACSNGRIFKLNWGGKGRTREVKQSKNTCGYFYFNSNGNNILSHRFIAMCFIPNPYNLPEVNHKNEDKSDNRVENLEWCDHKYNMKYGTRNERAVKKTLKPVLQFTKDGKFVAKYYSAKEAQRQTGVCYSTICGCCRGKRKSAGGFIWRFAD